MKLRLPLRGVSRVLPSSQQPRDTTADMDNMRGEDCRTQQYRIAVRAGLSKYIATQVNGNNPIRALRSISFSRKNLLYSDRPGSAFVPFGDEVIKWSAVSSSRQPTTGLAVDRQGNVYSIDGRSGIEKRNSVGDKQWKLALPVNHEQAVVRALQVATIAVGQSDGDVVLAGVSEGGLQSDARLWVYKQVNVKDNAGKVETRTEQVSELETDAYIERIKVINSLAYTAQNEPDKGRSFIRIYAGLSTPHPEVIASWEIPYPVNGMDVNEDGEVITAHPPNLLRGKDPRNPTFSARDLAHEYRIEDHLSDYKKRIWGHWRASDLKDLGLKDGDPVPAWPDLGPGFRELFAASTTAADQPIFVENGIGGLPSIRFLGKTLNQRLDSGPNPAIDPQYDDQQKTIVPGWVGCKWAMVLVLRVPYATENRPIFYQESAPPTGADAGSDSLLANRTSSINNPASSGAAAGKICWYATTDATGTGAGLGVTGGARHLPFSGDYVNSGTTGTVIVAIGHDGHSNTATDAAQHSFLRVNGRPIDRWLSADQAGVGKSTLGLGNFSAYGDFDVAEIIVLRDYIAGIDHTGTGNKHGDPISGNLGVGGPPAVIHYPRSIGAPGASTARAWGADTTNRFNDNEVERFEGMLAGDYGVSHLLPCGTASRLSITTNPLANDTVTIDATVYTFVAALTGAANEVFIGASARESAFYLYCAINGIGERGVKYAFNISHSAAVQFPLYTNNSVEHPTVRATAFNDSAAGSGYIKIETRGSGTVNVAESTGAVRMAWSNATTTATLATVVASTATYLPGHYIHPFGHLYGFPRPDVGATLGIQLESKGRLLTSTEGILARWDANGKIAWVLTSRLAVAQPSTTTAYSLPATDQKFGGVGYDCAFSVAPPDSNGDGGIYSVGPMYSTSPGTQSEQACIRRVIDNKTSVAVTGVGTWTNTPGLIAGAGANDSLDYQYVRIAVDTFDRVYLPFYEINSTGYYSLICIRTHTSGVSTTGIVDWTWARSANTTNPSGLCVAIDPNNPDYDGDPATRAFGVYVGTRLGWTADLVGQPTIYRLETVNVTHLAGVPPSETRLVAVSNGSVRTSIAGGPFLDPVGAGTLTNPVFALDVDNRDAYISAASLNGEVFLTDGRSMFVYNARNDTIKVMKSKSAGDLKARARLLAAWRGRLVWARFADSPFEWLMSALGNAYDYDLAPTEAQRAPLRTQAVLGSQSPKGTGQSPDIVNALVPATNDTMLVGCESSVWLLDGDPMDGGRFWRISGATGMAFGSPSCNDETGTIYFFGTRGCVYTYRHGESFLRPLSETAIPAELLQVDFSKTRVEMVWDNEAQGFHVLFVPVNASPTGDAALRSHYFYSRKLNGWYPESFASIDLQPTCTFVGDGDLASNRRTVIGCMDGYVRCFDSSVDDDDGVPILSNCRIGPLAPDETPRETHFKDLKAVLASGQGGCGYRMFASSTPDNLGLPVASGTLEPGRNDTHFVQGVGSHVAFEVNGIGRYAIESLDLKAIQAGQKQPR